MNSRSKNLHLLAALLVSAVTLADLAGFFPGLPLRGEAALIAAVAAGSLLIMLRDYGRRFATLRPLARVTRAPLPVRTTRRLEAIVERAA